VITGIDLRFFGELENIEIGFNANPRTVLEMASVSEIQTMLEVDVTASLDPG
jgi:hypothetical protein